jgi:pimeloyl-ACP methyl ester carboxylesterase/DNA-binding CsgD family transcriptional regulator
MWGSGLPLLRPPGWLSHQGLLGDRPGERDFARDLARLPIPWLQIQYDKQGTGLSSHERTDFSLAAMVEELEVVVDHLRLRRVALMCNSVAAMPSVVFAVQHPQRVSRLVLVNPVVNGSSVNMPRLLAAVTAIAQLAPHEREIAVETFTYLFDLSECGHAALQDVERPSVALALWATYAGTDVTPLLAQISAPTLVVHSRHNRVVHFAVGVEVAARIRGARLIAVDGTEHLFNGGDEFVRRSIVDFLSEEVPTSNGYHEPTEPARPVPLTRQQLHVLELIAAGKSSRAIAADLVLSERTVQRHIGNVYAKLGIHNRAEATAIALNLTHT